MKSLSVIPVIFNPSHEVLALKLIILESYKKSLSILAISESLSQSALRLLNKMHRLFLITLLQFC